MNIFIKSFNRPYYLDRCIESVLLNVADGNLSIIVLDDGTHPKYLDRIKEKYPSVEIKLSPFYDEKVNKISKFLLEGEPIREMEIPTQFWLSSIEEKTEDYFIILEDDIWFKDKLDVDATVELMKSRHICMLKLFYFNNSRLVSGTLTEASSMVNVVKPSLFTRNEYLFKKLLLGNPFRIWSVLGRFNIKNKSVINYYTIYNVAGAVFSKKYYAHLWKGFKGTVNENEQLIKALNFYNTEKSVQYGVVKKDVLNTSFSSSATNRFAEIDFDPFIYNHLLNESWYDGSLKPMSGYPQDISEEEIESILNKNKNKSASVGEWRKWVNRFKDQYRKIGFSV